jgi:Flp pilus assembly protein TadD
MNDGITPPEQAIVVDKDDPARQAELGRSLLEQGQLAEAEQALRLAVQLDPGTAAYHADLARILLELDSDGEAERAFRAAAQLDPANAAYQGDLGSVLLDEGRDEEAVEVLQKAVRLDPDDVGYHADLGQCLLRLGRFDEAEIELRKAVDLDQHSAAYRADLGQVLLRLDRLPEAEAAFREAAQLDPDPANKQIADLRTALSTASDERIVKSVREQVDRAWDQNALEQRGVVRSEYVEHVDRITRLRLPVLRVPFKNLEDAQRAEAPQRAYIERLNRRRRRRNRLGLVSAIVIVAAAIPINLYWSRLGLSNTQRSIILTGLGVIVGALASIFRDLGRVA